MDEIVIRFPRIAHQIFEQMENQDLTKCREVGKNLRSSIDQKRLIWTRMIKNCIKDDGETEKWSKSKVSEEFCRAPSGHLVLSICSYKK